MKNQILIKMLALGVASFLSVSVAHAQIGADTGTGMNGASIFEIDGNSTVGQTNWNANFTTTNDLLDGLLPSSSAGSFTDGGISAITDGVLPPVGNNATYQSGMAGIGGGQGMQLIYNFNTAANLTELQLYGGWPNTGRSSIPIQDIEFSTDGGANYTTLGGLDRTVGVTGGDGSVAWIVTVKATSPGLLASNVTNLRFDFDNTQPNGYQGLAEIAAFGTVPEPGTWALCLSGLLVLSVCLFRRRLA